MTLKRIIIECDLCKNQYDERIENVKGSRRFFGLPMLYNGKFSGRSGYEVNHLCPNCSARLDVITYYEFKKIESETPKERGKIIAKLKKEAKRRHDKGE